MRKAPCLFGLLPTNSGVHFMVTASFPNVKSTLFEAARELIPEGASRAERRTLTRFRQASLHDFVKWYRQRHDLVSEFIELSDGRVLSMIQKRGISMKIAAWQSG